MCLKIKLRMMIDENKGMKLIIKKHFEWTKVN